MVCVVCRAVYCGESRVLVLQELEHTVEQYKTSLQQEGESVNQLLATVEQLRTSLEVRIGWSVGQGWGYVCTAVVILCGHHRQCC